jgi:hypothetical protein
VIKKHERGSRNPRRNLRRDFGGVREFSLLLIKKNLIIGEP